MVKKIIYTLILLTIPFLSNIFLNDFNWNLVDFIIMGILIFSCLSFTSYVRNKFSGIKEILAIIIVVIIFILLWVELAVGIFGSPFAGS
tara:strand:- start:281 stop:547 length:267 start_codon:yes stop_codon:yes gene_type:complete